MDNRRQFYRHSLVPSLNVPTEITCPGQSNVRAGTTLNLSIEGLALQFEDEDIALREGDTCSARLAIPGETAALTIPCKVVYQTHGSDRPVFGLHFLPVVDSEAALLRETIICRFLFEEQRKQRRKKREENQ